MPKRYGKPKPEEFLEIVVNPDGSYSLRRCTKERYERMDKVLEVEVDQNGQITTEQSLEELSDESVEIVDEIKNKIIRIMSEPKEINPKDLGILFYQAGDDGYQEPRFV